MLSRRFLVCLLVFFCCLSCHAFTFNFNSHQQQQQQRQQQRQLSYEELFLNNQCPDYLCPDTLQCVKTALDCPCPFPASQLKCPLPNGRHYVCISKPATHDPKLAELYDDPVLGPKAATPGLRDCAWVARENSAK